MLAPTCAGGARIGAATWRLSFPGVLIMGATAAAGPLFGVQAA